VAGTNKEKIIGYFIEEANEHLETLEKGILELSSAVDDEETINELFRAAHSIKGGAAMLGFASIQKTAHRLEDAFKILRDQPIEVDQTLESLFLKGYDILQSLLERLQGPFGLKPEEGEQIMQETEPHFTELLNYLKHLSEQDLIASQSISSLPPPSVSSLRTFAELSLDIKQLLRQMLVIFKQPANPENRQHLETLCSQLANLFPYENGWQNLLKTAQQAIANPKHSYRLLAPVIIKEIKLASDCLEVGKGNEVMPSQGLQQLAQAKLPQVLVTLDPQTAANTLSQVFNQEQLSQLVKILQTTV
jgi:chemotaxis protein histidine kinase CheA